MPDPSAQISDPAARQSAVGGAVIVVLVAAVAGWLHTQRPPPLSALTTASRVVPTSRSAGPGFRPDAWFLPDDDLLGFVEIPSGPFSMGSDPVHDPMLFDTERWTPSGGASSVDLPVYYIGRYEVTVAQFSHFVEATGFRVDNAALSGPADHPVAAISWPDALAYCRWLEETLAESSATPRRLRQLVDDGWHVSLPTEAEWEKAARGTDGRIFPWGDEPRRDRANYDSTGTTPVGSFNCPECPFGLSDASGNVWELTRSAYRPYPYEPQVYPNLDEDALWVMRGGSYGDPVRNVRAAIRGGADPGVRRPFIGFRVALTRSRDP